MSDHDHRNEGEIAVLQRFPADRKAIEELTAHSEDFRDMCEELAASEQALRAAEMLPPAIRAERIAEWIASIERLSAEITKALRSANVVRIDPAGHRRRRS